MNNNEIAKKVVDRMLETIEKEGVLPWAKPWTTGTRSVEVIDGYTTVTVPVQHWSRSGRPYQGINNLLLNMAGKHGEMITFNQCKAEGGRIKKGAKSAVIVVTIPVLKTYNVFSVETDVEGLEPKHSPAPQVITIPLTHLEPVAGIDESAYDAAAEAIIADYVARAQTLRLDRLGSSDRAYYSPVTDSVVVPNVTQFSRIEESELLAGLIFYVFLVVYILKLLLQTVSLFKKLRMLPSEGEVLCLEPDDLAPAHCQKHSEKNDGG